MTTIKHLLTIILIALAACSSRAAQPTAAPTATTVRVVQTTPVPTIARDLQPIATATENAATDTPPTPDFNCAATAGQPTARHTVTADVDYNAKTVSVRQQVRYINRTNEALPQIAFSIEPNRYPGIFTLDSASQLRDGTAIPVPAYELTGRRLTVDLDAPLPPGCALELEMAFRLALTPVGQVVSAYSGYLGYTARQFNLGLWLAAVAPRQNGAWMTHDAAAVGEQTILDIADWDITFNLSNAPDTIKIAAPGTVERIDVDTWRFRHVNARDFSLSMSEMFNTLSTTAENGVSVEIYYYDDAFVTSDNGRRINGAEHALDYAARSLAMYSDLFGAYPYGRFVVVQADFPDGMEFSDLVFVGGEWFRSYKGTPASYLTIITVHEVAHQWWYARVGSDQAMTPWLDESLATYSEFIFYEEYYPDLKNWWWNTRVHTYVPQSYTGLGVDSSVYQFSSVREYINAVYLRGAKMLDELRADVGTEAFFDWLRRYSDAGTGRVVMPDVFWSLLTPEQLAATQATREGYLGH